LQSRKWVGTESCILKGSNVIIFLSLFKPHPLSGLPIHLQTTTVPHLSTVDNICPSQCYYLRLVLCRIAKRPRQGSFSHLQGLSWLNS